MSPKAPNVFAPFLSSYPDGHRETKALYWKAERLHDDGKDARESMAKHLGQEILRLAKPFEYQPLTDALSELAIQLVTLEGNLFELLEYPEYMSTTEGVEFRDYLRTKIKLLSDERHYDLFVYKLTCIFDGVLKAIPKFDPSSVAATVPLYTVLPDINTVTDSIIGTLADETLAEIGLFNSVQNRFWINVTRVSGVRPDQEVKKPLKTAAHSDLPPLELIETYLGGTPFLNFLKTPIPFSIPDETRFAGHWILAPSGKGKTVCLTHLFLEDLKKDASIILMDAKGELTGAVRKLKGIEDRLVIIEPHAKYPLALNPLDIPKTNLVHSIALFEYVFSSLLEAKLTALQSTLFRNLFPAIIECVPNPTLMDFRRIVESGFGNYANFGKLAPLLRQFFETQFNSKTYVDTRNQLIWRLDFLLTNPLIQAMFHAPKTKLDIGKEMDAGKIIIINNSTELLGDEGSEFFGRFFVSLVLSAAQQRSSRKPQDKLPCFFYIDECAAVISRDPKIATILDTCRSQKIGLILAHQRTDQIKDQNVLSALYNCAVRFANSDDEAKLLSDKLRTTPEFLRGLPRGTFAAYVRDLTASALAIQIPFNDLSKLPQLSRSEQEALEARMRAKYCFVPDQAPDEPPEPPSAQQQAPEPEPPEDDGDLTRPKKGWK